jgi:uncharacterized protein YbjT (DUF2867 family)
LRPDIEQYVTLLPRRRYRSRMRKGGRKVRVSEVLVTGGTGLLGCRVVERLRAADRSVRVLSRSGRSEVIKGDLLTGAGLVGAVRGVDAIMHCASDPSKARQTEIGGTENLLRAARADVPHVVYVSIVGVDRNPISYYQAKLAAERVIESSLVPWTILRATQFHEFLLGGVRLIERLPVAVTPKGFLFQPIDLGEVADRLVELALAAPAGRVLDVGGPEVRTAAELVGAYFEEIERRQRVLEFPLPGKIARAFREGAQVCPGGTYGRIRWEDFLRETVGAAV